ncbi:antitoxin Xre/MbcA/ParS toxin-binding domain-containing protein [Ruegeria atlantica]|uniref:antitoxin Xre/MbcA/ParS toxin-binding domain-containing protein n=1 Tax=Ruegeria atlantica TaxID=81569 RepID=UPI0024940AE3|nr:antitoxin Xre/MbcA/ParS toxin-binding domain-containing protein [Ruegeria atlantica]
MGGNQNPSLDRILEIATRVLGSRDEAEAWMSRPAFGLSGRKPVEMLSAAAGIQEVEIYLTRLEYGVHT